MNDDPNERKGEHGRHSALDRFRRLRSTARQENADDAEFESHDAEVDERRQIQEEAQAREEDRLLREAARRSRRYVAFLFLGLAFTTLGMVVINYVAISKSRERPTPFSIRILADVTDDVVYRIEQVGDVPQISLEGRPLPGEWTLRPGTDPVELALSLSVPNGTVPGTHSVALRAIPQDDSAELRSFEFPVSIRVSSWSEDWAILIRWLIILGSILLLLYLVTQFWIPCPSGRIQSRSSSHARGRENVASKTIRCSLWRALWPWGRNRVAMPYASTAGQSDRDRPPQLKSAADVYIEFRRFGFGRVLTTLHVPSSVTSELKVLSVVEIDMPSKVSRGVSTGRFRQLSTARPDWIVLKPKATDPDRERRDKKLKRPSGDWVAFRYVP